MKRILFVLGLLIGGFGVLLYQWVKPIDNDPYFFLSPKIAEGHPINIPIKLYKKGDSINFVFWKTPILSPKLLYLFPVSPPSSHIILNVVQDKNTKLNFYPTEIFTHNGPIKNIDNFEIFRVKLYKVNSDMSEYLISDFIHRNNIVRSSDAFTITPVPSEYGQYRLKVTVLGEWPELEINGLSYFITIKTYVNN
ncbi:TPA: hypothetical protein MYS89_000320 [Proteus mirabilis]|uniref:hypothetical protein n=1 Tax=Proteus mirabilis TaxID=584 RepID=UPI001A34715B|nr:hypothetical protein [Proteus mirabilis]MDM3643772.1 hypothetical protein [Proteus mirabilis]HAU5555187.1 hypothetical protein [Proteus mirabilis]HCB2899006.1 hypothetical protein [Proteus mirabilis]HCB2907185.1 hypothetical protein [Proteus mirabilis]HCT3692488.1 hypothetical protein [Proteus mirabilis]